ncbi:MAG: DUF4190 domain-containing protein [Bacillota bacterium]|nr:DUF4190 domain-containing protein [Bacillota bacterium]
MLKKCQNCEHENNDFNQVCEVCHIELPEAPGPGHSENGYYNTYNQNNGFNADGYNNYGPNNYGPNNGNNSGYNQRNNSGTAALVFGILSVVFSLFCCVGVIFGILAIVMGNGGTDGNSKAGKVLGIIGTAIYGVILVINIIFISSWTSNLNNFIR